MMNSQKFCLKWDGFQSTVTSLFDSLRQDGDLVDITLCCEGQRVRAHRMMLSACSPYFRELLKANQYQQLAIFLKDTSVADLNAVIEFMYKGSVNVSQSQLPSFIKTAEMLQIRGLSREEEKGAAPPSPRRAQPPPPASAPTLPHKRRRLSGGSASGGRRSPVSPVRRPRTPTPPPVAPPLRPPLVPLTITQHMGATPEQHAPPLPAAPPPLPPPPPPAQPPPPPAQPQPSAMPHRQGVQTRKSARQHAPPLPSVYNNSSETQSTLSCSVKVEKIDLTEEEEDDISYDPTLGHGAEFDGSYDGSNPGLDNQMNTLMSAEELGNMSAAELGGHEQVLARVLRAQETVSKRMAAMAADMRELKEARDSDQKSLPRLPVQSVEELDALDMTLADDRSLQARLVTHLQTLCCPTKNVPQNVRILMRRVVGDIATSLSLTGKNGKPGFGRTLLFTAICDALQISGVTHDRQTVGRAVTRWLSGGRDRLGGDRLYLRRRPDPAAAGTPFAGTSSGSDTELITGASSSHTELITGAHSSHTELTTGTHSSHTELTTGVHSSHTELATGMYPSDTELFTVKTEELCG